VSGRRQSLSFAATAQARWRAVNAPHLVFLLRAGARFENGNSSNDPTNHKGDQQAA
jgi:putative transposase